jgi:hypothetical protein
MASHPSRAALIKLLKRRRGAERKDRSAMWVLLDYLLSSSRTWVSRRRRRNDQTARERRTLFTQSSHVHRRALVALMTTPKPHRMADRACIRHRDPGAEAASVAVSGCEVGASGRHSGASPGRAGDGEGFVGEPADWTASSVRGVQTMSRSALTKPEPLHSEPVSHWPRGDHLHAMRSPEHSEPDRHP